MTEHGKVLGCTRVVVETKSGGQGVEEIQNGILATFEKLHQVDSFSFWLVSWLVVGHFLKNVCSLPYC